ncbi:MAG: outer membrane protein transport protein [Pseudomonadales bacterium]|nr:outer membrane protein transport protein [Pseudomonadales bacterium]MCP5320538.1 outer membrane protein transport protein [Pseudomonadales bacterium]MCP5336717.1 outer membrane protein transport protein [Pseudomonadales bacterium]
MHQKHTVLAGAIAALLAAPGALATNGYFSHGYSMKEKALAGAGVALPQDALAAATNPAGMVKVGDRIDAGALIFSPHRSYTVRGNPSGAPGSFGLTPGTVKSGSEYFLIPHFGWNHMIDDERAIGVSVYGNGGMNTDWPGKAGGGAGTFYGGAFGGKAGAGVDLAQLFVNISYAQQIGESTAVGISPILAYQRFEGTGLAAFAAMGFSRDPARVTDKGHDNSFGYGARIGVTHEVQPGLVLGATYQTKIYMDEFDRYSGLFAEKGGFDIPATATIGLAWDTSPTTRLVFDVQRIWYSDIPSVGRRMLPGLMTAQLGDDKGAGFGWRDMTVFKLGYQWTVCRDWTWRVGYSFTDQPIPSSEVLFNILAPGIMEQHFTAGFTQRIAESSEWSFAVMYAPEKTVRGANPLDPVQRITLRMDEWEVGASYAWKF